MTSVKLKPPLNVRRFLAFNVDFGSRFLLLLGYLVVLSRAIGPAGIGIFASMTAITTIAAAFVGLGSEQVLMRRTAQDLEQVCSEMGRSLFLSAVSAPIIALAVYGVLAVLPGIGLTPASIVSVILADLVFTRIVLVFSTALFAAERPYHQSALNILFAAAKMAAALIAVSTHELTLETWCYWYSLSCAFTAVVSGLIAYRVLGAPLFTTRVGSLREGLFYAFEFASMAALKDLDKPIVNSALGPQVTGAYTMALRAVDTSCVPIRALLQVNYLNYFRLVHTDPRAAVRFALRNCGYALVIGVAVAAIDAVIAPLLPLVIGSGYASSVDVIYALLAYPAVLGLTSVGADLLRALDRQAIRLVLLVISYAAYVPLIYFASEAYGLNGAVTGRMAVQVALMALTWIAVLAPLKTPAPEKKEGI